MQSSKKIHNLSKRFTKYRELEGRPIKVKFVMGSIMHRIDIEFRDGNSQKIYLHKIGDTVVLSVPRMWEYPMEKLAVLDYVTQLLLNNQTYLIVEDKELYKEDERIDFYRISGTIKSGDSICYGISTELFEDDHFTDYDVRVIKSVAKDYNFPVIKYE